MGKNKYETLKVWREKNLEAFMAIQRRHRKVHKTEIDADLKARREGTIGPHSETDGPDWMERNAKRFSDLRRARVNASRRRIADDAIAHYGGKCFCCGETNRVFLILYHIEGGGNQHCKTVNGRMPSWAKSNGWPPIFRVACHNCNFALHFNGGICPHQSS